MDNPLVQLPRRRSWVRVPSPAQILGNEDFLIPKVAGPLLSTAPRGAAQGDNVRVPSPAQILADAVSCGTQFRAAETRSHQPIRRWSNPNSVTWRSPDFFTGFNIAFSRVEAAIHNSSICTPVKTYFIYDYPVGRLSESFSIWAAFSRARLSWFSNDRTSDASGISVGDSPRTICMVRSK